jgi:hypothetical protein
VAQPLRRPPAIIPDDSEEDEDLEEPQGESDQEASDGNGNNDGNIDRDNDDMADLQELSNESLKQKMASEVCD